MSTLVQPTTSSYPTPKLVRSPMRTDRPQMQHAGSALPKGTVERPYHIASTMPTHRLDSRSRSKTTESTHPALDVDLGSKLSKDVSSRRRSQDVRSIAGSIQSRADRSDSMTKSLFARGTKLLKRQNSKSNLTSLRTLDWVEASYERDQIQELAGWRLLKNSRIDSTGSSKEIKQKISEPYNFQHLTHAHATQFLELERTRDNELVSEFSAIRASQAPRRELRGIKAECLHSRNASSEALDRFSPPRSHTGLITPPTPSPTRPRDRSRNTPPSSSKEGKTVRSSPSIDNFSHPSPKGIKLPTPPISPTPPPLRVSSRAAFARSPNSSLSYQASPTASMSEQSITGNSFATSDSASGLSSPAEITSAQGDIVRVISSDIGHAMTTPDDSALTIQPLPFNSPGAELANMPEEVESFYFNESPVRHSRVLSTDSVVCHSKAYSCSIQRTGSLSQPALGVLLEVPGSPSLGPAAVTDSTLPDIMDTRDVSARSSLERKVSALHKGLDESWEDDIDWCYDHAAEADCDFEWDCQSRDGDEVAASSTVTAGTSTDALTSSGSGSEDNSDSSVSRRNVTASTSAVANGSKSRILASRNAPDLTMPELEHSSTESAQSSAISLPEAVMYSQLRLPPHCTGDIAFKAPPSSVATSPHAVYIPMDLQTQMDEALYQEVLSEEYFSEHYFQLYDDSIDPSKALDDSPRSSHSPPSTCESRESVALSGVDALTKQRRRNNSFSSLPELIHSKTSRERFDLVAIQLAENIAALITTEPSVSPQRKRGAKEVAPQSILKKANSCGNLLQCLDATAPEAISPVHHGRAHSEGPAKTLGSSPYQSAQPPTLRRMHSAGVGILLSKPSYTLFPTTTARGSP